MLDGLYSWLDTPPPRERWVDAGSKPFERAASIVRLEHYRDRNCSLPFDLYGSVDSLRSFIVDLVDMDVA